MKWSMQLFKVAGALVGMVVLPMAGCGGGGGGYSRDRSVSPPVDVTAQTVMVRQGDYQFDMPSRLQPGLTVFAVTNSGSTAHNFEIMGQGAVTAFARALQPGENGALLVMLEPGTYQVFCPAAERAGQRSRLELVVTEASAAAYLP